MNNTARIVLGVILALAVAGGCFYGGMVYGKSQANAAAGTSEFQFGGASGAPAGMPGAPGDGATRPQGGQRGQGGMPGGMLMGTIKELGDGVLTLTDVNGKDTQVKVTDTTLIEKSATVKLPDLAAGETLIVSGSTGTDGTVTARSIQVASPGRFGMGQGAPAGGATPAP